MEINLECLKEIYNTISKEDREEQNINNFEDFMEYIKAIIIDNMYYDFDLGRAGFEAPVGWIEGELTRKRQFKIRNSVMEYAIESSTNVQDEVLQKELAHTSDEKMKSIISTIQREQNVIIRNEKAKTLIIQGVAGSGKTSIALHRIAFLLYRFKNQITAEDVAIVSPNRVCCFEQKLSFYV